jgi:hypothetical protein
MLHCMLFPRAVAGPLSQETKEPVSEVSMTIPTKSRSRLAVTLFLFGGFLVSSTGASSQARGGAPQRGRSAQPAPSPQTVSADETLRGDEPVNLVLSIKADGVGDIDERSLRAEFEAKLRRNGIRLVSSGYPQLRFRLTSMAGAFKPTLASYPVAYTVWDMAFEFVQTLPLARPAGAHANATTWSTSMYGVTSADKIAILKGVYRDLLDEFLGAYGSANPDAATRPGVELVPVKSTIGSVELYMIDTLSRASADAERRYERQLREVRDSQQQVLVCKYGPLDPKGFDIMTGTNSGTGFISYFFWYPTPPAKINEYLDSMYPGQHPFRKLGTRGVEKCPASPEIALRLRRTGMRAEDLEASER